MTGLQLPIAGNETTRPTKDENGCVVSMCCEAQLVPNPNVLALERHLGYPLAPDAYSWDCSECGAHVEGVGTRA